MTDVDIQSNDDLLLEHEIQRLTAIMESKDRYRKVIQAAIARWVRDFQDGKIHIRTVDDLNKLVEMDLRLQREDS